MFTYQNSFELVTQSLRHVAGFRLSLYTGFPFHNMTDFSLIASQNDAHPDIYCKYQQQIGLAFVSKFASSFKFFVN